jgi:hypothetical protein
VGDVVVALSANFLAFYLGAVFIERAGIFCGIAVFLITALAGTIAASKLEKCLGSKISRLFFRIANNTARHPADRHFTCGADLIPHKVRTYDNH